MAVVDVSTGDVDTLGIVVVVMVEAFMDIIVVWVVVGIVEVDEVDEEDDDEEDAVDSDDDSVDTEEDVFEISLGVVTSTAGSSVIFFLLK